MTGRIWNPTTLALVVLTAGCPSPSASSNHFEVFRDGEKQRYDHTTVRVEDRDPQLILYSHNTRDPIPDAADDESSDSLRIAFREEALRRLALEQDHVISGEGAWTEVMYGVGPTDVTFTGGPMHTDAVEHLFFHHQCFGCFCELCTGAQSFEGTLRLSVNEPNHLAGEINLHVEGNVPGTDDSHQYYDLRLVFDQRYESPAPDLDAGTDAGTDSDAGAP